MMSSTRETRRSVIRLRSQKKDGKGIFVRLVQPKNDVKGSEKNPYKGTRCHRAGCFQCEDQHEGRLSSEKKTKKKSHRVQRGSEKKPRKEGRLRQCENIKDSSEKKAIAPIGNESNIVIAEDNEENCQEEWEVTEVQCHWMCPETLKPLFKVKYTGWKGFYLQPVENLLPCPMLVEKMEHKTGLKMRKVWQYIYKYLMQY